VDVAGIYYIFDGVVNIEFLDFDLNKFCVRSW
jgi:hypothetical protein